MQDTRIWRNLFVRTSLCLILCLLSSCPLPITGAMVTHVKDKIAPTVVITSPAAGCVCANIVEIVGKATDAATAAGNDGQVSALSYAVSGSTVSGKITAASDGGFSFQFSTVTLGTNFTLTITAVDWNSNSTVASLPLQKQSGNGIPSFAVTSGNQQVTLTWNSVPNTTSYTLYYTTDGALPSEQVGQKRENVTSPLVLTDCANGNMHVFQLKTVPQADWPESDSDYLQAIPLSAQSLAPKVSGEFRKIRVEWPSVPSTQQFEVWRATEQNGTYYNLSGPVEGNSYVDSDIAGGTWYWYKVRPTLAGSALSCANAAQADPFCLNHPQLLATCPTTTARDVAISGSYAYVADSAWLRVIDISNPASPTLRGTCATIARMEWPLAVHTRMSRTAAA